MKYIIFSLCIIAIFGIMMTLNIISKGNVIGIGLGDYIFKIIGMWSVLERIRLHIFE